MTNVYWLNISNYCLEDLYLYMDVLDVNERRSFCTFKCNQRKKEYIVGRLLLKTFLSNWTNIPIKEINFGKSEFGKLYLKDHSYPFFNLSHSGSIVACVISRNIVGIDCEVINNKYLHLAPEIFSSKEMEYLNKHSSESEKEDIFFEIWTRKEAYLKALGIGLQDNLKSLSVPISKFSNRLNLSRFYTRKINENCMLSLVISQSPAYSKIKITQISLVDLLQIYLKRKGDEY